MNIVDIVIIAILGLSVLVGLYRGFISSVASMAGCLLSLGLSFWLSPKVAALVQNNPDMLKTLVSYTDAATKIGDQTLAQASVASLNANSITEVLNRVNLPGPLNALLQNNLQEKVFITKNTMGLKQCHMLLIWISTNAILIMRYILAQMKLAALRRRMNGFIQQTGI